MQSGFISEHFSDTNGNPEGGVTFGNGFAISWQRGPLGRGMDRKQPNGAFVEDIIAAAVDRIEYYQASKFNSQYNADALLALKKAMAALDARTRDREKRNVEGTHSE